MNSARPSRGTALREGAFVLLRWVVGALFVYLGLSKALDPVQFLKLIREYEIVASPVLLNVLAVTLPWIEVFLGILLISGVAVQGSALVLILMLVPFTLAVLRRAWAIHASQGIPFCAVRFDCGCGLGEVWICSKLAENTLLLVVSAGLLAGAGRRWCARYRLLGSLQSQIGRA
jgi:uncharacterized membrane protein YphA (DoxX/SURF4 family)